MYLEWIKEKPFTPTQENYDNIINVTLRQYTDIFNGEFNLSFFKHIKYLCDECEAYKLATLEEKMNYKIHIINICLTKQSQNRKKMSIKKEH